MAIRRPFLLAVAAALHGGTSGCAQLPPPETAALTALREQQSRLVDELRALRLEVEALSELQRAAPLETSGTAPQAVAPLAADLALATPSESPIELPHDVTALEPPPEPPVASSARHWVDVAHRLVEEADYATAIRVLNVAVDVDPELDGIYFERGVARHLLQSYADAIDDFERCIVRTTRQDTRFICLYNQACGLARLGRPDEAIDKLQQSDAAGFRDLLDSLSTDSDLDSLRELPRFRELLQQLRER